MGIKENQELPTIYWSPKLHKRPYNACFVSNSSSCTTAELSKPLISRPTSVKNHFIKYCENTYEKEGKDLFWSIKCSSEKT